MSNSENLVQDHANVIQLRAFMQSGERIPASSSDSLFVEKTIGAPPPSEVVVGGQTVYSKAILSVDSYLSPYDDHDHTASEPSVSEVSRYELDAKLEAVEARMDTRIQNMENMVRQVLDGYQDLKSDLRATETRFESSMQSIQTEFAESRRHTTSVAWATVGGVFAALAIIIGAATAWQTASYSDLTNRMGRIEDRITDLTKLKPATTDQAAPAHPKAPVT